MNALLIRLVDVGDLDALLNLYRHLNPGDPHPQCEEVEARWKQILSHPTCHVLVAEVDGRVLGTCTLTLVPNLTRGCRPYRLIENVVVDGTEAPGGEGYKSPDGKTYLYRGLGIGTRLLHHALQIAWDAGAYKVMLMTTSKVEHEHLHRFYERAGFDGDARRAFYARNPTVEISLPVPNDQSDAQV